MKFRNEPLWSFLETQRASGVDVRVFPSNRRDDDGNARFTLRVVDPDEPETGHAFLASFSKNTLLDEAKCEFIGDKPTRAAVKKSEAWDAVLQDAKQAAKYVACHCIIEEKDVDNNTFTEDRIGTEFVSVTIGGEAKSISGTDDFADEGNTARSASGSRSGSRNSNRVR